MSKYKVGDRVRYLGSSANIYDTVFFIVKVLNLVSGKFTYKAKSLDIPGFPEVILREDETLLEYAPPIFNLGVILPLDKDATKIIHKCQCDRFNLVNFGCNCGGI